MLCAQLLYSKGMCCCLTARFCMHVTSFDTASSMAMPNDCGISGPHAGAPRDLVQIVTGYGEAGNALVTGGVDKVIFVGSTGVGKAVMRVGLSVSLARTHPVHSSRP